MVFQIRSQIMFLLLSLAFSAISHSVLAGTVQAPDAGQPLVVFNVGVDLTGLEQPAEQAAQALTEMAMTMQAMSTNPQLTEQEKLQVLAVMSQVEQLTETLEHSLVQMPLLVEQASVPIVSSTQTLLGDLKWVVILVLVALLVVIAVALSICYFTILRPAKDILIGTTNELNQLAKSMEHTAKIVELSGQYHEKILMAIEQQSSHANK